MLDLRAYFIHAVGGRTDNDLILPGFAECTQGKVNAFIAAVAQKNIFFRDVFQFCNACLQFMLQRIGITVIRLLQR